MLDERAVKVGLIPLGLCRAPSLVNITQHDEYASIIWDSAQLVPATSPVSLKL
jgi:hypothetical protein